MATTFAWQPFCNPSWQHTHFPCNHLIPQIMANEMSLWSLHFIQEIRIIKYNQLLVHPISYTFYYFLKSVQKKIARRNTGAKGYYFLAVFLQISNLCVTHLKSLNKVSNKSLKVPSKSLPSLYLVST